MCFGMLGTAKFRPLLHAHPKDVLLQSWWCVVVQRLHPTAWVEVSWAVDIAHEDRWKGIMGISVEQAWTAPGPKTIYRGRANVLRNVLLDLQWRKLWASGIQFLDSRPFTATWARTPTTTISASTVLNTPWVEPSKFPGLKNAGAKTIFGVQLSHNAGSQWL